jgi:ketosteroid isomerase-like protein
MSEENVELARRYFEVFNAQGLDGAVEFWHPEIELYDPPEFPDADRYVGVAAVRERAESYMEVAGWDGKFRELEYVDAGEEVVVVWRGSGHTPGRFGGETIPAEMDLTVAQVFLFEDGKVRRCRQYLSREEGLKAAGLSE